MTVTYLSPTYWSLKLIKEICWLGLEQLFDLGYVTLLPLNLILFLWKMEVIIPSPQGCLRIQWEEKLWKELSKHSGTCSKWELFLCLIFLVLCGSVLSHGPVSPVKGQKFWGFGALSQKGRMHSTLSPFYPPSPGFIMYLIIYPIPPGVNYYQFLKNAFESLSFMIFDSWTKHDLFEVGNPFTLGKVTTSCFKEKGSKNILAHKI